MPPYSDIYNYNTSYGNNARDSEKNFLTILTVAQISDTHLFANQNLEFCGINTTKSLISEVFLLKSQPPVDLLLFLCD
jgi:hypothetical protein